MRTPAVKTWLALAVTAGAVLMAAPRAAWADLDTSYSVSLRGYALGTPYTTSFSIDSSGRLGGLNAGLSGAGFRAEAGSVSAPGDDLGFSGRSFDGLKLSLPLGKAEMSVVGGSVVFEPDILDPLQPAFLRRRQIRSTLFGLRLARPLGNHFRTSFGQFFAPGAPSEQGAGISSLALSWLPGGERSSNVVKLELARSRRGSGVQISTALRSRRLDVEASVRRADRGFSSAGSPQLVSYRNGYGLSASLRAGPSLSARLLVNRYDDGFVRQSSNRQAGLYFSRPRRPSLGVFYQARNDSYPLLDPILGLRPGSQVQSSGPGVETSFSIAKASIALRLDRLSYAYPQAALQNTRSDRFSLFASRSLGRKTLLSLSQVFSRDRASARGVGEANKGSYTSLDVSRELSQSGLRLSLGFESQNTKFGIISGSTKALRVGLDLPAGRLGNFGFSYRTSLSGSGNLRSFSRDQLYIRYSRSLDIGPRPSPDRLRALSTPQAQRRALGRVIARVFEDANNNGRFDSGEGGIGDIGLLVRGGDAAQTEGNGTYTLASVSPGSYNIKMDLASLPIDYTMLAPPEQDIKVASAATVTVDFPVLRTGQTSGVAFNDANRNGKRDEGEAPLANAVVRVENSDIITFTDDKGRFTLYSLPPKQWKVFVDAEALADGVTEYDTIATATIAVRPNKTTEGLLLAVAEKPREVIFADLSAASPTSNPASSIAIGQQAAAPRHDEERPAR